MLNELQGLAESARVARITADTWHDSFAPCPKGAPTILTLLDNDGAVAGLERLMDRERIGKLRKFEEPNQGISFPIFNVPPLFHAGSQMTQDALKGVEKALKSGDCVRQETIDALLSECTPLWDKKEMARVGKCLQVLPCRLAKMLGTIPADLRAMDDLLRRVVRLQPGQLNASIKRHVISRMAKSSDEASFWIRNVLVSGAKSVSAIRRVSVVLEVADRSSFPFPANHEKVRDWVNERLMTQPVTDATHESMSETDAFGEALSATDSKTSLPRVVLPVLGNVRLRAMSAESPCQMRYGRAESYSFPVGTNLRQQMKKHLEWLCGESRRGRTWADVSGTCGYTRRAGRRVPLSGVLLAYPSVLSQDPPELAGAFVAPDSEDQEGVKFEAAAARVIPALEGMVREHPDAEIRVFVLTKPDGFRTKVALSLNCSAKRLIAAAQAWQDGSRNIPPIGLNLGTKDKPDWIMPLVPFPAEVVNCLSVAWLQGGTRADPVHGLTIGDGIALLVEAGSGVRTIVERALRLAVGNSAPLLLALGHAHHRGDGKFSVSKGYTKHARLLPSILGLLLFKLGYEKGGYMHTAPFLIGQTLALADTLHKAYCEHQRKGDVPPQLIGNALMPVALDNPAAGLARLSERMAIYQAWANTAKGDDVGLAKWALQQLGKVADELGKQPLPDRCGDAGKAQMLLGYLARPEARTTPESRNSSDTNKEV